MAENAAPPTRVMFVYWGRRGAMSQFSLELGRAAQTSACVSATISVSRQNESFTAFQQLGLPLFPIDTFQRHSGAVLQAWRIPLLRQQLRRRLLQDRTQAVIELMPHVWSSLITPVIRDVGVPYLTIVHDSDGHVGDYRTNLVSAALDRSTKQADRVLTLSQSVANRLIASGRVAGDKISVLFHPDFTFGPTLARSAPETGQAFKLLFLGRIMAYKGLPLFLDAVDALRAEGQTVEVGVFGEGALGDNAGRLAAMGAEVVNRWLTDTEIAAILPRFDAMVLSYIEASQSGVAAAALGAGLPVIATPVGGLVEQVTEGQTGVLASRVDALAFAEATKRLLLNPDLYRHICMTIAATRETRSMMQFIEDCVSLAGSVPKPR
jgi:glycosyltransferase involved in cell wall biosynthesis